MEMTEVSLFKEFQLMVAMWDPPKLCMPLMDDLFGGEISASNIDNQLERGFSCYKLCYTKFLGVRF